MDCARPSLRSLRLRSSLAVRAGRGRARGFTLLEMMAVVIIIGILAAAALPSFAERIRDRRANEAAQDVALFYRAAKARAVGRGAAQLVHYETAGRPNGNLVLYEAIQPPGGNFNQGTCGPMPQPFASCTTTPWVTGVPVDNPPSWAGPTRQVSWWPQLTGSAATGDAYNTIFVKPPTTTAGGGATIADVCFTPGGRTFARSGAGALFTPLSQILSITAQRYTTTAGSIPVGLPRQVLLPPNGEARLFL